MFLCKFDKEKHYGIIADWWEHHKYPLLSKDFLPENGFLAVENDQPIAAIFLFKTDSTVMHMDFPVTNPKASSEMRHEALKMVTEGAKVLAKELGFKTIFTYSDSTNLINRYESLGFIKCDTGVTHLVYKEE